MSCHKRDYKTQRQRNSVCAMPFSPLRPTVWSLPDIYLQSKNAVIAKKNNTNIILPKLSAVHNLGWMSTIWGGFRVIQIIWIIGCQKLAQAALPARCSFHSLCLHAACLISAGTQSLRGLHAQRLRVRLPQRLRVRLLRVPQHRSCTVQARGLTWS